VARVGDDNAVIGQEVRDLLADALRPDRFGVGFS
jgi:hypothetical protein